MDFPTINQLLNEKTADLKFGVYMSKTVIDGKEYFGMTNVGKRPTFPSSAPLCETHIFDYFGDLYGKNLRLYLLEFIREERKFSGIDELRSALQNDKKTILDILKNKD
jgi:riboflavin kinase/FMN adenylyltransferase